MPSSINNHQKVFEVKTSLGYKIIDSDNIVFLEAKGKFTIIHFDDHSKLITYHMLKWYTKFIFEPFFFRCHKSYIINCSFVEYYTCIGIILKDCTKIPLSRSKTFSFKENLISFVRIQT